MLKTTEERSDSSRKSKKAAKTVETGETQGKDFQLSIFHALGKFLYNKRIDPKDPKQKVQLPYSEMRKTPRPRLYFKH